MYDANIIDIFYQNNFIIDFIYIFVRNKRKSFKKADNTFFFMAYYRLSSHLWVVTVD